MSKNPHAKRNRIIRAVLHETWPDVFAGRGEPKKPLAIGIGERVVLALPEFGAVELRRALEDFTSGPTYLKSCVEGADRIDLNGQPRGVVTKAQADHARARLAANEAYWRTEEKAHERAQEAASCAN